MKKSKNQNYWDFPHPMIGATILIETALSYGLELKTCLLGTNIDIQHIGRNDVFIEPQQEFQLVRNVLAQIEQPHLFSLEVSKRSEIIRHGILGITTLNAKTFLEALQIMIRFSHFNVNYCYIEPTIDLSGAYLKLHNLNLPSDLRDFYLERDMIGLVKAQVELNSLELQPTRIQFTHDIPDENKNQYRDFFGIDANFSAQDNRLYIRLEALNCTLPTHDEKTLKYGLEQLQLLKLKTKNQSNSKFNHDINSYTYKVFKFLYTHFQNGYSAEMIAKSLNINSRTLHRKLELEGSSYFNIFQQFQIQRAESFLKQSDISLENIAEQLGYSELSSFSRAFKKWKGVSPKKFRQSEQSIISR